MMKMMHVSVFTQTKISIKHLLLRFDDIVSCSPNEEVHKYRHKGDYKSVFGNYKLYFDKNVYLCS